MNIKRSKICTEVLPYLMPSLKNSDSDIALTFDNQPVLRKLNNGLVVAYLLDSGEKFQYVQNRDLSSSGLTEAQLYDYGLQNLKMLMQAKLEVKPYGHIFAIFLDGNFEASLLLIDDLWDKMFCHLATKGFVAAAPTRDVLAFCDIGSNEGISELRTIVDRTQTGDHAITPILLRRHGKNWLHYAN
ncbi:MAG: DUF1444 family protein [Nitrosospira sp.]